MNDVLLRVVAGPRKGASVPLPADGAVVVGRKQGDLCIDDPQLSGRHFEVRSESGLWVLRDLGSTNGVLVDGRPAVEVGVAVGAQITAGGHAFELVEGTDAHVGDGVAWLVDEEDQAARHFDAVLPEWPAELTLPRGMSAIVEVVAGPDAGQTHRCSTGTVQVGRGAPHVRLSDSEVSRLHALIEVFATDQVFVRDLGSMNGITHNGAPVKVARVVDGDAIGCGRTVLRWCVGTASQA